MSKSNSIFDTGLGENETTQSGNNLLKIYIWISLIGNQENREYPHVISPTQQQRYC